MSRKLSRFWKLRLFNGEGDGRILASAYRLSLDNENWELRLRSNEACLVSDRCMMLLDKGHTIRVYIGRRPIFCRRADVA